MLKQVDKTAIFVNPTPTKPIKVELPKNAGRLLKPHKQYLIKRGFNPNQITKLWQIYGIGISTTLSWRIVIPIFVNGELVSWTTRSISDNHRLRYVSAPKSAEKVHHKHTLYGIDNCNTTIIITEGPFDVWRIGYGAVATFGVAYTREQVLLMKNFPRRIICFDNDAITQAYRLAQLLAIFDGQTLVVELDSKDPASAANKEISLLRKML
ncbi:MAG: hypothetical protein KatS3mg087_1215 [Patescibacteria group bacterium]|nr:MAG: hypothetical protein KatS3mg087_1215 [Patescibacteria group bacterium]